MGTSLAAEPLLSLAVTVTSEQRVESVLQSIVQGLAAQPGVALARIWLLPSVHHPSFYHVVSDAPDCLCLVASAGTPVNSPAENWSFLQGHFARVPFNVGKVGQVAASRHPILVEEVAAQNDWIVRPDWAKREQIRSFAGHPLIFREKLLGVIAVFSRQPLGHQEFTWLGLFANQAALAIANACAEEALQSTERNLAAIIDTIPTLTWTMLPDGSNEFLSKRWEEYTGLSVDESVGWGWQVAFHPDDLPALLKKWQKMLASGEAGEQEARLRRHDGVYRWFLIRAQALRNDSGKIVRWYGTSTDIEELKQAEQARRASERNLAAIINTIPTSAWTTRPDGYCDFLNQVWLDYAGVTAEQAQGWGWADSVHPDDRKRLVEEWQSCLASGTPVDTEARIRRFDSSYRWFLIRGNPLRDEGGKILKWYGTCVDIEDRKRGEEALHASELSWRQIVDNIPGFVATTGAMGEVEFLNRQTLEYFGNTTEELKDWALIGAVHPDDLPRVIEARKKSIETGQIYEVEHRCRRADGIYRWFQVRGLPARNAEGTITAWYLLLTDIEDRKWAEEELRARELDARSLLDNMPGLLARLSPDGTPEFFNRQFLQYLGKSVEEIRKWKTNDIIHPDDLAHNIEVLGNAISGGEPFDFEYRIRRFDGVYRWFRARGVPVRNVEGQIFHWNALVTDIDDRKKAEKALQSSERDLSVMIDAIPGMIHTARPDGYLDYFNRRWLEYLGCSLSDMEGWNWTARIHPDDRQGIVDKWRACLASGEIFEYECRVRRGDGQYRWMFHRKVPLRDEHRNIVRWYGTSLDIEDRKRAEEALQSSERNLRLMINAIPIYIHVLNTDGSVQYVNQAVLDYYDITLEDAQKDNYRARFFHPEDVERLRDERREALKRPIPFENEQRVLGKDGKYRWFLIRYNPLLDKQGRIDRWYTAALDIEDRKRAERALQSNERNLSLIINTVPTQVACARPDGSCDFVNQGWLHYTGLSAEQAQGSGWEVVLHPDNVKGFLETWQSSLLSGVPLEAEVRIRRFDGSYRWFLTRGNPLRDESGNIVKWYITNMDIDDRKRAEAQVEQAYVRLAEAQRLSKTGSFIIDFAADDHNWSEEVYRIFGFEPGTEVTVEKYKSIVHPEDWPAVEATIQRAAGGADFDLLFRIFTADGAVKHLHTVGHRVEQGADRKLVLGAVQDVTESKLAEEALNRARSELAHVTRVTTLDALTASIAHEVNQPLSGIVSNASASLRFLSGDSPNLEEAREAVRDIVRDGKRAGEIITRIRSLTKRTATRREKLELNETISEVLALIGDEAKRHNVFVRTQFADSLSPVAGDRVQLHQVVLNLVMNAIEAMSVVNDRPRELVITTENIDADCVLATFEDSGTGIASATVDKIFDSFYTTKPGGMGMGLSISRSILQSHGGRLWAVSKDAPGTMFHFTIPRYREEGTHAPPTGT